MHKDLFLGRFFNDHDELHSYREKFRRFLITLYVTYNKFIPCLHQWISMEIATAAKRIANKTAKAVFPATHSPFTMPILVQCE